VKSSVKESTAWGAGLLLAAALIYGPGVRGGFLYDDHFTLEHNPAVRSVQPVRFFSDPTTAAVAASGLSGDYYRPLVTLSYSLGYRFWGLKPLGYRLENLLWHLLNTALLLMLLRRLGLPFVAALIGAAAFCLHPAQPQSVVWINQRSTLYIAAGIFAMLLLVGGRLNPSRPRWLLAIALWTGALFSKEIAIVAPALLALVDFQLAGPGQRADRKALAVRYGTLLAIASGYLLLRHAALRHWSQVSDIGRSARESAAMALIAFPMYLGKILVPLGMRPSYDLPVLARSRITWGVLLIALFALFLLWAWRRRPRYFAAALWVVIGLAPVLQIVPVRAFFADRFLYLPLAGFGWLLAEWVGKDRGRFKWAGLWILAMALVTARQVPHWRSDRTLWSWCVVQEPSNAFAHAALGDTYGPSKEAEDQYLAALSNYPGADTRFTALNNLAWLALQRKEWGRAEMWARKALAVHPGHPVARQNLERALARGRKPAAKP
jgi:hypothetical protein